MLKYLSFLLLAFLFFMGCNNKNTTKDKQMNSAEIIETENDIYMLVGTYTSSKSKGIYVYRLDTVTGKAQYISETEVNNPSYLVLDKNEKFVYSVTEDEGVETSAANAFSFDKKTGKLTFINKQLTEGGAPCFINIDASGKYIVTANYSGADVSVFQTDKNGGIQPILQKIQFTGKGVDKERQKQPHIHCVQFTPDEAYLLVNDLGTDKIHKLNVNPNNKDYLSIGKPSAFPLKPGSGPRHLTFHPNEKYAYLITEISGEIVGYEYKDGNLSEIQTIKADTLNAKGSADIHVSPDGKFVYASNRLLGDGIAIFSIDLSSGKLTKAGYQPTGKHPRNFAITPNGSFLLAANRDSNNIQVFKRDKNTGLLYDTNQNIDLDMPVCVKFASIK